MINQPENVTEGCGCDPNSAAPQQVGCKSCSPNLYLTCDEETILAKMRELKQLVRPISLRMSEIERSVGRQSAPDSQEYGEEWSKLSGRLDNFRSQWSEWEKQLDEAIERKLIMLGHREPPA